MESSYYQNCLREELSRRCEKNPRYSLRSFSRALGFEATVISQILSGKRVPSLKTAERLLRGLGLSPGESEQFLASLAEHQRSRGLKRVAAVFEHFGKGPAAKELSLDVFRVIADWHHYSILALTFTTGFKSEISWIAAQLGISQIEAKLAVERLLKLGLLVKVNGRLKSQENGFTTADKATTNAALKRRQKQILEKAVHSLENDPLEKRNHSAMCMAIDPDKLPLAKSMIESFTQKLCEALTSTKQKQVYELSIALFPVSKERN